MSLLDDGLKVFGLQFTGKKDPEEKMSGSLAPPLDDEGAAIVNGVGSYGVYMDTTQQVNNELLNIQKYREISLFPEVDIALQDIINEAVPQEENTAQVELVTDELPLSDDLKVVFAEEFEHLLSVLQYNKLSADLFRRWYVDGRLYFQVIVDTQNPDKGIQELRLLDATKVRKVKEIKKKKSPLGVDIIDSVEEYFIYNEAGFVVNQATQQYANATGVKISADSIIYVPSGYTDGGSGTVLSYLFKAIRPVNQLRMLEDSTVVYQIARAPERRIFYVDVGNLPKLKAEQYLKDMMNRYRNKMVYDAHTGCFDMNTKVPLLDGRVLSLSDITKEYEEGKKLWAYSCDPKTGGFAPGLITWAGVTRKDSQVMKLTLDNGEEIVCTLDHKFPVWNKGKTEAKDLVVGDSMIPFYSKEKSVVKGKNTYKQIFNNDTKKWEFVHRLVSDWKDSNNLENEFLFNEEFSLENKKTVHHINYNRYDNTPSNLTKMSRKDHFDYHKQHCSYAGKIGGVATAAINQTFKTIHPENDYPDTSSLFLFETSSEYKSLKHSIRNKANWTEANSIAASLRGKETPRDHFVKMSKKGNVTRWGNSEQKKSHSLRQTIRYPENILGLIDTAAQQQMGYLEAANYIDSMIDHSEWKELNKDTSIRGKGKTDFSKFGYSHLLKISKQKGFKDWRQYKDTYQFRNHKISKIEYLTETMDVGTLTIDGKEIYHDYHTFALDAGIYTFNSVRDDKKYMSMLEDYWMPRREGGKGTEISTLPGVQNMQGMMDNIMYFQEKLYQALNIPISRLKGETGFSLGRTTEISRDELKFQKFIDRLRNKFAQLFYQMLRTHLRLKGILNDAEWENEIKDCIKFKFQRDNYFSELKNLDVLQARMALMPQIDPYLGKYFSKKWVQQNILQMTDKDIEDMDDQIDEEKDDPTAQPSFQGGGMDPSMMGGDQMSGGMNDFDPSQEGQPNDQDQGDPNQQDNGQMPFNK